LDEILLDTIKYQIEHLGVAQSNGHVKATRAAIADRI